MAIKTINYTVTTDSVFPAYEQNAGMQYDHKKTQIQFNLEPSLYDDLLKELGKGNIVYRIDCTDGEGNVHLGDINQLNGVVLKPYDLEYWVTRFGGKLNIKLIITISVDSVNNDVTTKYTNNEFTKEVVLYLEDVPETSNDEKSYKSLSTLTDECSNYAQQTKAMRDSVLDMYQNLNDIKSALEKDEWIFDSNTDTSIDVDFIVEKEFDTQSNNALANSTISKKFDYIQEQINKIESNNIQELYDSIKEKISAEVIDSVYPIGSYYWSDNPTNPTNIFKNGSTWEQVKDVFLLAAGDQYACGTTGGEAKHLLTQKEMPKHSHGFIPSYGADGIDFVVPTHTVGSGCSSIKSQETEHYPGHWATDTWGTTSIGGNQVHNNMPPYIAVYCWKRIA